MGSPTRCNCLRRERGDAVILSRILREWRRDRRSTDIAYLEKEAGRSGPVEVNLRRHSSRSAAIRGSSGRRDRQRRWSAQPLVIPRRFPPAEVRQVMTTTGRVPLLNSASHRGPLPDPAPCSRPRRKRRASRPRRSLHGVDETDHPSVTHLAEMETFVSRERPLTGRLSLQFGRLVEDRDWINPAPLRFGLLLQKRCLNLVPMILQWSAREFAALPTLSRRLA
jgi:hypothetical protein